MKNFKILFPTALLLMIVIGLSAFKSSKPKSMASEKSFVLIELFTSEGCSSCPPADELVAKIQKEDKDKPVYILAYHVDYWNNLGWKDQFSSAAYSQRQRQYASWLKLSQVYTPQIVVNGKKEFVGSDEGMLRNAIQANLQKEPTADITLTNIRVNRDQLILQYQTKTNNNQALLIAFVQKSASTNVGSGENGGRTLSHINIVKALNTVNLRTADGTATVPLPKGFSQQTWDIVGFVQNTGTGEVVTAQRITVSGRLILQDECL